MDGMQSLEDEFYRLAMLKKCVNINQFNPHPRAPCAHTPPKCAACVSMLCGVGAYRCLQSLVI